MFGIGIPLIEISLEKILPFSLVFYRSNVTAASVIIFLSITALLFIVVQPYKHRIANISIAALFLILNTILTLDTALEDPLGSGVIRVMMFILLLTPHCVFLCCAAWKIKKITTTQCSVIRDVESDERELLYTRSVLCESSK